MSKASHPRRDRTRGTRKLAQGRQSLRAGDCARALTLFSEAATLIRDDASLLHDMGVACLALRQVTEAISWLQQSIALHPNAALSFYNLGRALECSGDTRAAIRAYQEAVILADDMISAHARMAELLWACGKDDAALASYKRAVAASPQSATGRVCQAMVLYLTGHHSAAIEQLRSVVAGEYRDGHMYLLLGRLQREAGQFDDSASSFRCAIDLEPLEPFAYQELASTRRFVEADRAWINAILVMFRSNTAPRLGDRENMSLHFAAGKIFDDLGDYATALEHFELANTHRQRLWHFDLAKFAMFAERITSRYTSEFITKYAGHGSDDETPVLIVGMPRSGTTLVERIVSSHPAICGRGELAFWRDRGLKWSLADPDLLMAAAPGLRDEYVAILRDHSIGSARVTDKMPFNFLWLGLIHVLFPRCRIIHCRRNPLDTCFSIYATPLRASISFASSAKNLAGYYNIYARLMNHWRQVLPEHVLTDVDYEQTVTDKDAVAKRLIEFVGLDWHPSCSQPEKNNDVVKTASHWQARQPVYADSIGRSQKYESWVGPLQQLLNTSVPP